MGDLAGKKVDWEARDISGIACIDPPGSTTLRCLVVNDENRSAQFVTISGRKIVVGSQIRLVGNEPDTATVGVKPEVSCPGGKGEFGEFATHPVDSNLRGNRTIRKAGLRLRVSASSGNNRTP
jgi:hypothetical protein